MNESISGYKYLAHRVRGVNTFLLLTSLPVPSQVNLAHLNFLPSLATVIKVPSSCLFLITPPLPTNFVPFHYRAARWIQCPSATMAPCSSLMIPQSNMVLPLPGSPLIQRRRLSDWSCHRRKSGVAKTQRQASASSPPFTFSICASCQGAGRWNLDWTDSDHTCKFLLAAAQMPCLLLRRTKAVFIRQKCRITSTPCLLCVLYCAFRPTTCALQC